MDRLLICSLATEPYYAEKTFSSVVLDDGVGLHPLTQLGGYYNAPPDGLRWSTWYLTGATVGDNRSVVATLAGANDRPVVLACVSYSGVDQSLPFSNAVPAVNSGSSASLTLFSPRNGSMPWGHVFSSNNGLVPVAGINIQQPTSNYQFSYLVDGGNTISKGNSHTFSWSYNGTFGAQGAMILPSVIP